MTVALSGNSSHSLGASSAIWDRAVLTTRLAPNMAQCNPL